MPLPLWYSKSLDVNSLAINYKAGIFKSTHLPSKYSIGEGSKVRFFESAVSFVKDELGHHVVKDILQYMQISSDLFKYPDKNISINLLNDFNVMLRKLNCDDNFFIRMGEFNAYANTISKIDFRQRLKPFNSLDALKSVCDVMVSRVEKNYSYDVVELDLRKVKIRSRPRKQMIDIMKRKRIGSFELALYRFGYIANFPVFFGYNPANREKSKLHYNVAKDEAMFEYIV